MRPTPQPSLPSALPAQAIERPAVNTAPPFSDSAPKITTVAVADDPRGEKRSREGDTPEAQEPVLKRARTDPVPMDPKTQALFQAIEQGDVASVKALFRTVPELRFASNPAFFGITPLGFAAAHGQEQIVDLLLRLGTPVEARDARGYTPLMYAAANDHVGILHRLCMSRASVGTMTPDASMSALMFAVEYKRLEAGKYLIQAGANFNQLLQQAKQNFGLPELTTPLLAAIDQDFTELIAFLLDAEFLVPDTRVLDPHSWNQNPVVNIAAAHSAMNVVRLLLERGASPDVPSIEKNGRKYNGLVELATSRKDYRLLECVAHFLKADRIAEVINSPLQKPLSKDILNHVGLWKAPLSQPGDGLKLIEARDKPQELLEKMAWVMTLEQLAKVNRLSQSHLRLSNEWIKAGLLSHFLLLIDRISSGNLKALGKRTFKRATDPAEGCITASQAFSLLIESLSLACGVHAPFSDLQLTTRTEQIMNRIFGLQSTLMLAAIAHYRAQFDAQILSLPDLCLDVYVSRTNRWNEADLYRKLTEEWGLYDPVACAILRLLKEAYSKLEKVKLSAMPATFTALLPSEQLRHVTVEMLEDWDKIPEIVEAIRQCSSDRDMEVMSELLFQQWRLFGEAFGVTKPRYSPYGPHQLNLNQLALAIDVDEAPVVAASSRVATLNG